MKRLLGHIALWVCCLFGALSLSGAEVPQRLPHDSGSPRTAAELVCSLDTQGAAMRQFIHDFRREDTLVLVDPVMGDHGKVYRTYTPEMCRLMGELAAQADLITPNATEAAILLEEDYANVPTTQAGMESWLARLSLDGRRSVVITGVSFAPSTVGAACLDCRTDCHTFVRINIS